MIDEGLVRGAIAVVSLATFLGICWWAYRPKSRARFEQDALLVFEEVERMNGGMGSLSGEGREGRGASA